MRLRQFVDRVFWDMPAAESLVELAPDVARTLVRGFIGLGIVGMGLGPLGDLLWHYLDPDHAAWYAFDWINVGVMMVWSVCVWATYLLPLYASIVFTTAVTIVAMTVAVFLSGGIDSPNAIAFAVPILLGVIFLGLRDSLWIMLICCAAYAGIYGLEMHAGLVAPELEHGDRNLTYVLILLAGLCIIWIMAWMISASLRYPLYDRMRASATQDALLAERERLLAMVSHELRTPLTNIVGFVEMIRHRTSDLDADLRQGLHANALQLLTMVNNLLDYAKIQQSGRDWVSESVDVPAVAEQILAMFSPALAKQNTVGDLRHDPAIFPHLMLDKFALERILINLVSNAVKHTEKGRVLIDLSWHAGQLTIKVVDTGAGMTSETLARVFEPFFHDVHTGVAGTGLGMALVQQMVQRMGGQIDVVSEVGKGTSVTLYLTGIVIADSISRVHAPPQSQQIAKPFSGLYLFVEDQPDIRALIEAFAQTLGVRAMVVAGIVDVPLAQTVFTGAFVDLQLAGASGVDAMQRLKHHQPTLPVWAMTANMMFRPEDLTVGGQFDGVIYKPFTLQQLEDALRAIAA